MDENLNFENNNINTEKTEQTPASAESTAAYGASQAPASAESTAAYGASQAPSSTESTTAYGASQAPASAETTAAYGASQAPSSAESTAAPAAGFTAPGGTVPPQNMGTPNPYAQYGQPGNPYWGPVQPYGFIGCAPNGVPYIQQPLKPKEKKPSKVGKFFAGLGLSALFGLVAACVFILSMWICKKYILNTDESSNTQTQELSTTDKNNKLNLDPVANKDQLIAPTVIADSANLESTDVSKVVEEVMPSIVSIDCTFNTSTIWGTYQSAGAGSGIVLKKTDKELLIATNSHVINGALTIKVTFNNSKSFDASLKGKDAVADLAVISIPLSDIDDETIKAIKVATLGNSDDIKVGQMAIAIGNSLGYGQSVTVGYISAKDREVNVDSQKMILLQTDAAINPGNSGGALLNLDGEVVGINSVKYADASVEGMGFAIPISRAQNILAELATREVLAVSDQGYLGIICIGITQATADSYNWPMGVYVKELVPDGAAEKAGMQVGDIIVAIDDTETITQQQLLDKLASTRRDTTVTVTLKRLIDGTHEEMKLDVTLGSKPADNADKDKPADTPESKDVPEKIPNSEDGLENTPFVTPDENDSQSGAPDNGNGNNRIPGNETPDNGTNPGDTSPYGDDYYDYYGDIFDDFFGYDPFEFFFGN